MFLVTDFNFLYLHNEKPNPRQTEKCCSLCWHFGGDNFHVWAFEGWPWHVTPIRVFCNMISLRHFELSFVMSWNAIGYSVSFWCWTEDWRYIHAWVPKIKIDHCCPISFHYHKEKIENSFTRTDENIIFWFLYHTE